MNLCDQIKELSEHGESWLSGEEQFLEVVPLEELSGSLVLLVLFSIY